MSIDNIKIIILIIIDVASHKNQQIGIKTLDMKLRDNIGFDASLEMNFMTSSLIQELKTDGYLQPDNAFLLTETNGLWSRYTSYPRPMENNARQKTCL